MGNASVTYVAAAAGGASNSYSILLPGFSYVSSSQIGQAAVAALSAGQNAVLQMIGKDSKCSETTATVASTNCSQSAFTSYMQQLVGGATITNSNKTILQFDVFITAVIGQNGNTTLQQSGKLKARWF